MLTEREGGKFYHTEYGKMEKMYHTERGADRKNFGKFYHTEYGKMGEVCLIEKRCGQEEKVRNFNILSVAKLRRFILQKGDAHRMRILESLRY